MWRVVQSSSRKSIYYRNGTLPPHPGHIAGFSSYIAQQAGALPHWVHCVLRGSLLTTVAVQPGRCRRFIGTLLARITYAPRTLRIEDKEGEAKVLPHFVRPRLRSCRNHFAIDLVEKLVMKVLKISFFRFCNFRISISANLNFLHFAATRPPAPPGRQRNHP
jgi:hypothetical protein